jgi:hypothetical protein
LQKRSTYISERKVWVLIWGLYAAGKDLDGELTLTISGKITCDKHG